MRTTHQTTRRQLPLQKRHDKSHSRHVLSTLTVITTTDSHTKDCTCPGPPNLDKRQHHHRRDIRVQHQQQRASSPLYQNRTGAQRTRQNVVHAPESHIRHTSEQTSEYLTESHETPDTCIIRSRLTTRKSKPFLERFPHSYLPLQE